MDVITTALVSALGNLSKDVIKDSYNVFKSALKKRFGENHDLIDAVNKLEKNPSSEGRQLTVKEEVSTAKVNDYPELVQLAQDLISKLKEQPGGQQNINQHISNVKYAATSATGSASISNITENETSKEK